MASMIDSDPEWEVCLLWHDKKHEIKLSIHKECEYRNTFCMKCNKPVLFERKPKDSK